MITTVPPHNIEAEQVVIGSILIEPDSLLYAMDILDINDFYREAHRLIYSAMIDIYELGGNDLNIISITERLKEKSSFDKIGGLSYLSQCATTIYGAASISYHCRIIKEKALLRNIKNWLYTIQKDTEIHNSTELITKLEQEIVQFSEKVKEKRDPEINAILSDIHTRWRQEKEGIQTYFPTDYKLNNFIPRYSKGHLWIVGGYTSVGKSTFLAQIISDICNAEGKALIFSLEDSREDKVIKLIANQTGIRQSFLMTGSISGNEHLIERAEKQLRTWHLRIYDDIYTVSEMRLKIKKHILKNGLDVVVIDFIQNLSGEGTLYERISEGITHLQKIAIELKVNIIVASQVSNEAMRSNSEVIGLKGAGELAACADIILWLRRFKDKQKETWIDCEIRKNRPYGGTGIIPLQFTNNWTKIERRMPGRPAHTKEDEEEEWQESK